MALSILIVDDSEDIHALLRARLRPEGVELHSTLDPAQALPLALERAPDLVLLDIDMPGLSGLDVCKLLKANQQTASIPVIFLSGNVDQATKIAGLDLGAIDYVTKPFDPAELRARVRSGLRLKLLQDQLVAMARIDGLTGLWNRSYLDSRLAQEIEAARRGGLKLSVLLFDVDHFKKVNDVHGHATGDAVLSAIGGRIQATLRSSDVACRYGGEEFALILPGTDSAGARVAGERMRASISRAPIQAGPIALNVTVSVGFASCPDLWQNRNYTSTNLLTDADAALYAAKRGGRNSVYGDG